MDWSYVAGYFDGEGNVRFRAAPSRPDYILTSISWSNTHLESLDAIRDFIRCGRIQHKKLKYGYVHQGHQLIVSRVADILRIGEQMLPHLVIKRQQLQEMMDYVRAHRKPISKNWGVLAAVGTAEIERLYREEGMTQEEISAKFGCHRGAVGTFMCRNGINGRRPGPRPSRPILLTDGNA